MQLSYLNFSTVYNRELLDFSLMQRGKLCDVLSRMRVVKSIQRYFHSSAIGQALKFKTGCSVLNLKKQLRVKLFVLRKPLLSRIGNKWWADITNEGHRN